MRAVVREALEPASQAAHSFCKVHLCVLAFFVFITEERSLLFEENGYKLLRGHMQNLHSLPTMQAIIIRNCKQQSMTSLKHNQ